MRKPILYSEDVEEVDGYVAVPVDDYVLYYDPIRADIDDIVTLQEDLRSSDDDRTERFWNTVEEI